MEVECTIIMTSSIFKTPKEIKKFSSDTKY